MNRLLLIIPAYNEEESILGVIKSVREFSQNSDEFRKMDIALDYVVVNDGSTDATASICIENGIKLIDLPVNTGLAGGFKAGMLYASENGFDCAVQIDADGQHRPEFITAMLAAMEIGKFDIVIGSRFVDKKKPVNARMLGSRIISFALRLTTGKRITDPTSGMRMYGKRIIDFLANNANSGPEPDTVAYLMSSGATVGEVQTDMKERTAGKTYLTFSKSILYMLRMTMSILFVQWFRKKERINK